MTGFHGESGAEWTLAHGVVGPTERSYWVVDQRLAAGAYPFHPDWVPGDPTPENLERLLDVGIDAFLNLPRTIPAEPTPTWSGTTRQWRVEQTCWPTRFPTWGCLTVGQTR